MLHNGGTPVTRRRPARRLAWVLVIVSVLLVLAALGCIIPASGQVEQEDSTGAEQDQPEQPEQPEQQQQAPQDSQTSSGSTGLTGSSTTQLALHSGPLPNCQTLGTWEPGQRFTVLARVENPDGTGTWYKLVTNDGQVAYAFAGVNAENVNLQGDPGSLPTESNFNCGTAQASGGGTGGQASSQSGGQTTGGQTTGGQTTGGQTTGGQTTGGQTTGGQTTGGQTTGGQTTGGQTTGGQQSVGQDCGPVDAGGCESHDFDDCTYSVECVDLCGNWTLVDEGTWTQQDNSQDICYGGDGGAGGDGGNCGAFDDGGCDPEEWVACDINGEPGTMKVQVCYDLCDNQETVVWVECGLG